MNSLVDSANAYLATRTTQEIAESVARVNASRERMGLAPLSDEAIARLMAHGR